VYQNKNQRQLSLFRLIKIAAKKSEDLDALREIFSSKYPGERAAPGFAIQYYNKFIRISDPSVTLTEENLPQRLPETIEELKALIQSVEFIRSKSKKEELVENIKSKYNNIDLINLSEDYLIWLNMRYIGFENKPGEIVHPIEEAMETLKKFSSIQEKYKSSVEFKKKVDEAGYKDISSIKDLTLDDMERIIGLNTSGLTVRVDGVEIKDEEFLGKFGEWNLWLPHTKETSVKIVGYDKNYDPKTTWCTARTKGSNLFYNYIGRKDVPAFLFYIIKDNPEKAEDWLSIGYISSGNKLVPDFSGRDGGLSVNRENEGLTEKSYSEILRENWILIKSRIESEIEKYSMFGDQGKIYISPARSIIEGFAKNLEELKKELKPKSNEEKEDFIKVILDSDPSPEVRHECAKTLARINPEYFLDNFSNEPWAESYIDSAAKRYAETDSIAFVDNFLGQSWAEPYLDFATKIYIDKRPYFFLKTYSNKLWAQPYIDLAAKKCTEELCMRFLQYFSEEPWAQKYLKLSANKYSEKYPHLFLYYLSREPWAQPYIDLAAKKSIEELCMRFLQYFSEESWANTPIESIGGKTWVEYAESIQKKSGYNKNSLTKLSRALNNLGLNNYVYAVEKLHKY
jgi:hypothetical protein